MRRLPQDMQALSPIQRDRLVDLLALMGYVPNDYARPGSTERPVDAVGRLVDSGTLSTEAAQALRGQAPGLVGEHDRVYSIHAIDKETAEIKIRKIETITYTITAGLNEGSDQSEIDETEL